MSGILGALDRYELDGIRCDGGEVVIFDDVREALLNLADEQVDAMLDAYLNHTHANGQAGIWYRCLACDYETDDFNDALRHPMRSALAAAAGGDDR